MDVCVLERDVDPCSVPSCSIRFDATVATSYCYSMLARCRSNTGSGEPERHKDTNVPFFFKQCRSKHRKRLSPVRLRLPRPPQKPPSKRAVQFVRDAHLLVVVSGRGKERLGDVGKTRHEPTRVLRRDSLVAQPVGAEDMGGRGDAPAHLAHVDRGELIDRGVVDGEDLLLAPLRETVLEGSRLLEGGRLGKERRRGG